MQRIIGNNIEQLPDFIIAGFQKSGSSTLFDLMGAHPSIKMSKVKEPGYFNDYKLKNRDLSWYANLFTGAESHHIIGEGSVSYSCPHPDQWANIYELKRILPNVKLIFIARHPIKRIISAYRYFSQLGWPHDLWLLDEKGIHNPVLLPSSLYFKITNQFLEHFSRDQMLIVFFEDLVENPKDVLKKCFEFIGVDRDFVPSYINFKSNETSTEIRMHNRFTKFIKSNLGPSFRWVPTRIRILLGKLIKSKNSVIEISPTLKEILTREIEADAKAFLKLAGKNTEFWRF